LEDQLRNILDDAGGLLKPAASLSPRDDLFAAGLTSFKTVGVMLAIEEEFDVVSPDQLLTRATFSSIAALTAAIESIRGDADAA